MSAKSELQDALRTYVAETLTSIHTVRTFCQSSSRWELSRTMEVDMLLDLRDRAAQVDLNLSHVTQSPDKGKALAEYLRSQVSGMTADGRRAELRDELAQLLSGSLQALHDVHGFLDAVETLAATSLHVFAQSRTLRLRGGVGLDLVRAVVLVAKQVCPLVLEFKRDTDLFFLPQLHNVEVLAHQLDQYIQVCTYICQRFEKSCFGDRGLDNEGQTEVELDEDLPEEDLQRMLDHIQQLTDIREDPHFRMAFLFQQEAGQHFVKEFRDRRPRMLRFLEELEEAAVQLDRMNTGARISTVAGSSVGAVGGILSIVGLALMPFTLGASLPLTMAGVGLGITSGVNSLVTTATEIGVNATQQNKAGEVLQSFMDDVQNLQTCVEEAKCQTVSSLRAAEVDIAVGVGRAVLSTGSVGKGIDSMVDTAYLAKLLKNEEIFSGAGKMLVQEGKALRNIPRVASEVPDLGQAAAKSSAVLSSSARAGFIALNALFLGMDIFLICKDSISLAKANKTQTSQFIRARAALWGSVMDSWQKISDSLDQGLPSLEKKEALLETPFYPDSETKEALLETPFYLDPDEKEALLETPFFLDPDEKEALLETPFHPDPDEKEALLETQIHLDPEEKEAAEVEESSE
ncbi:uncharacterized protein LOC115386526 isoform X2 [Salarias fasciatus]|uniref:uncharacterized protein LOC115386526 isoform X2 n=1 Tax=Salarias fasciatus TaxID=181472 RepID=UPI001176CF3E|nr:uncharacterized protein LOC115386526 isoform X2 [Salarias fasciatus]